MIEFSNSIASGMAYLAIGLVLFVLAKYVKMVITPYDDLEELGTRKNVAVAISMAGYLVAVVSVLLGAKLGPATDVVSDLTDYAIYGVLGIVLLNLSNWFNDKIILRKFCNSKELTEDQNIGLGCVEFGCYVASGLVIAGAINGEGGGIVSALAFFAMAQIVLLLFALFYDWVVKYDLHSELEEGNIAAGVAFGGTAMALGIILLNGIAGDFTSWSYDILSFVAYAVVGFVVLPLLRIIVGAVLIRKVDLNKAISQDKNVAAAVIEMVVAVSVAILIVHSLDILA